MRNQKWNTGASVPIHSLTHNELKEAIHEWAEGSEELERLLWTCYTKGLETGGCHIGKYNNYLEFYINATSTEQLKRVLSTAESYGFAETFMMFGGNPLSGPNWYRTSISVDCLIPEKVDEFYARLNRTLIDEEANNSARCFGLMLEFAEFFEDKLADINFRMKVRNHTLYEFFIEKYKGRHNWAYLDELFSSFGMLQKKAEDAPFVWWYFKGESEKDFYDTVKNILEGIRSKWSVETPTEIVDDKDFNFNALLMQKKFGTTPEGVKKMNDWINENNPRPNGRKVNY